MAITKVLVVEDDLHTRSIIEMVLTRDRQLRDRNLCVTCASDGEEGLALFRENPPDLLVTDLLMPKLDGYRLIEAVRTELKATIPILATSAVVRDGNALSRLKDRWDVHLQLKPFSPKVLAQTITNLLGTPSAVGAGETVSDDMLTPETGGAETSLVLAGQLSEKTLASLLFDGLEDEWTGTLNIRRERVRKQIHFQSGHPIFVRSNLRGETLGHLLVRRGGISEAQHERVLVLAREKRIKYGEALVRLGLMNEGKVLSELVAQTRLKIESCLAWDHGAWHFQHDTDIGTKVLHCPIDSVGLVFEELKRKPTSEAIWRRFSDPQNWNNRIICTPRFSKYRARFEETFGTLVSDAIGLGCPQSNLQRCAASQMVATELDALVQAGMVRISATRAPSIAAAGVVKESPKIVSVTEVPSLATLATPAAVENNEPEPIFGALQRGIPADPTRRWRSGVVDDHVARESDSTQIALARKTIESAYLSLHEKNHYQVLGVIPDTDSASIEVAYRIKRRHFDLECFQGMNLGHLHGYLEEICQALDRAFSVLSDPQAREDYHSKISSQRTKEREQAIEAESLFRDASAHLQAGENSDALKLFDAAFERDPQSEYRAQSALALFRQKGRRAEAVKEAMDRVQEAIEADPAHPGPHLVSATISSEMGDDHRAIDYLARAISLDLTSSETFSALEAACDRLGDYTRLESEYRRAIFLSGKRDRASAANLWIGLASVYQQRLNRRNEARIAAEAALKLAPTSREAIELLAQINREDPQRWGDAIAGFRSLLRMDPHDVSPIRQIFEIYLQAGQEASARSAAQAAQLYEVCDESMCSSLLDPPFRLDYSALVALNDEAWDVLRDDRESVTVGTLLRQLRPLIERRHPLNEPDRSRGDLEMVPSRLVSIPEPFDQALKALCSILSVEVPEIWSDSSSRYRCELVAAKKPFLMVSASCLRQRDPRVICFYLARALAFLRPGRRLICGRSIEVICDYLSAAVDVALEPDGEYRAGEKNDSPIGQAIRNDRSLVACCVSAVEALRTTGSDADFLDVDTWCAGVRASTARVALLISGSLKIAGEIVRDESPDDLVSLIDFGISAEYYELRASLRFL